jgi:polysaccharide biosynthesis transport protein
VEVDFKLMDSKPFSVAPYLDIVYRHRRIASGVFAVGISLTLCLMVLLRDVYVASAVIMIEPPKISPSYVSMTSDRTEPVNVADQLEALSQKAFTDEWLADLIVRLGLYQVRPQSPEHPNRSLDALVKYMRHQIVLEVPPATIQWDAGHAEGESPVVLTISFEYSDRHAAQRVANELARRFIEEGQKENSDRAADATRFLQTQVSRTRAKLDEKAAQKRELEQRFAGSLPDELPGNLAQLDRMEEQLQMVNERMSMGTNAPFEQQAILTPEQQLVSLKLKLTHLSAEYSDEYPDIIDLKAEIANLKAQIASEPTAVSGGHADFSGSAYRERLEQETAVLKQKMQIVQQNVALTPEHGQEVAAVSRDYDAVSAEYHQLLEKQMAAELRQNLAKRQQDEQLRLLNPVTLPKAPKSPNRLAIGGLGVLFSFAAALALPFGLFFTDTSFKGPEELEQEYGIPVTAAIPVVDEEREQRRATIQALILSTTSVLLVAGSLWAYAQWFRS